MTKQHSSFAEKLSSREASSEVFPFIFILLWEAGSSPCLKELGERKWKKGKLSLWKIFGTDFLLFA